MTPGLQLLRVKYTVQTLRRTVAALFCTQPISERKFGPATATINIHIYSEEF